MRIGMIHNNPQYGRGDVNADLDAIADIVVSRVRGGESLVIAMSEAVDRFKIEGIHINILRMMVENRLATEPAKEVLKPERTKGTLRKASPKTIEPRVVMSDKEKLQKRAQTLLLKLEDQAIIDNLPELLGFKFCPKLGVESGLLPPLESDFVPPEYELAYLTLVAGILAELEVLLASPEKIKEITRGNALLFANETKYSEDERETARIYASLPAGLRADGMDLNPTFARNLWLNLLGYRLDTESPNSLLAMKDGDLIPLIKARKEQALAGMDQVQQTITQLMQQSEEPPYVEEYIEEDVVDSAPTTDLLPAVKSDIPKPEKAFYEKTSNQLIGLALAALVGYYLYMKK